MFARHWLRIRGWLIAGVLLAWFSPPVHAALYTYLLKIEGINGTSTVAGYKDWIEVVSYAHGLSRGATNGSPGTTRSAHQELRVHKNLDRASPSIFDAVCRGTTHTVTLVMLKTADLSQVLKIEMEHVVITSAASEGPSGDTLPLEEVSFNYARIHWTFYYKATGLPTTPYIARWDAAKNQPIIVNDKSSAKPIMMQLE